MKPPTAIELLNRIYAIHNRSLPMYLSYTTPWLHAGDEEASQTLQHVVEDQKATIDRLGQMILDLGGDVESGEFPMAFTSLHDLSIDYLIGQVIAYQQRDVATIGQCVEQLQSAPMARALAEEALGAAKGHLDSLEELNGQASGAE